MSNQHNVEHDELRQRLERAHLLVREIKRVALNADTTNAADDLDLIEALADAAESGLESAVLSADVKDGV